MREKPKSYEANPLPSTHMKAVECWRKDCLYLHLNEYCICPEKLIINEFGICEKYELNPDYCEDGYAVPEHTSQSFKLDSGQTWKPGISVENLFNAQGRGQWLSFMSTDRGWTLFLTTEPELEDRDALGERRHRESDPV